MSDSRLTNIRNYHSRTRSGKTNVRKVATLSISRLRLLELDSVRTGRFVLDFTVIKKVAYELAKRYSDFST